MKKWAGTIALSTGQFSQSYFYQSSLSVESDHFRAYLFFPIQIIYDTLKSLQYIKHYSPAPKSSLMSLVKTILLKRFDSATECLHFWRKILNF